MVSMTVRNVPDSTRDALAARAASVGQSLQEYMRTALIELGDRRTPAEYLDGVRAGVRGTGVVLTADEVVRLVHEARNDH